MPLWRTPPGVPRRQSCRRFARDPSVVMISSRVREAWHAGGLWEGAQALARPRLRCALWSDPPASGSRRVDGNSLSRNLASQMVCLVSFGIEDGFGKRAAKGCAAGRHGNHFNDDNPAEQGSCRGVVIQGEMVNLVSEVSGLLPYAQAEILLRRRTRAGIQNFCLIAVKLSVSEVELRSVCNGWTAGGIAQRDKLKTPH